MYKKYLIISVLFFSFAFVWAQKGSRNGHLEIIPPVAEKNALNEKEYPSSLHNPVYKTAALSPRETAWSYLKEQGYRFGISDAENSLKFKRTRSMPSGYRVRFSQVYKGYPVYKSGIVISINKKNEVVFVANGYHPDIENSQQVLVSESEAMAIAKDHLSLESPVKNLKSDLVIFYSDGQSRLVRKINFIPRHKNIGDWEFLIDAENGEIIQARDQAFYSGKVFDPDPVTRADADYGDPGFSDNGDNDSPQLNAQLVDRELPSLTFANGTYRLQNEYASIVDYEDPFTGIFEQGSSNFNFDRSQDGFEAVNVFYHIDQSMRYINETLGIELRPYQYSGGVRFDPHGLEGEDNSWYIPGSGYIAFGDGGVDDAEDQDVIIHELGHGIHDWITDGELSQIDGLSEGSSDYWAQSYKRSLGFMDDSHSKYDWVASWDGHNSFWAGRVTNYAAKYPGGLVDQIHTDGQIWSTALMKIYDRIGRNATDINFLSALSMLNESSGQRDAAWSFVQADIDNYDGAHLTEIGEVFTNTGYIENPLSIYISADITGGPADLTVTFNDIIDGHSGWQWDFDNDGVIDSQERNPSFTFTETGLYTVKLTLFDGINTISDSLVDFISVNDGVFVWEGLKNGRDNSGKFIHEFLRIYGVPAVYSRSSNLPSSLLGYDAVLLSFGAGDNATVFNGRMRSTIEEYLLGGGNLYIEGADAVSSYEDDGDFLGLLGLDFVDDGAPSRTYVSNLAGQAGSIFEGIVFKESLQIENGSIDRFFVKQSGTVAFVEGDYGDVAIQYKGSSGQKTVLFSYALSELMDTRIPNTRNDVLINILKFFDVKLPLVPRFSANRYTGHFPLTIHFSNNSIFDKTDPNISWFWDFDNNGVYDAFEESGQFTYEEAGEYDVRLTSFNGQDSIVVTEQNFVQVFDGESALEFNDDENYVQFEPHPLLSLTDDFSITFRFFPLDWGISRNGFGRIFDKGNIQIYLRKLPAGVYNAKSLVLYLRHTDGSTTTISTPDSSVKLNEWHYVMLSYNASENKLWFKVDKKHPDPFGEYDYITNGPVLDSEDTGLVLAESLLKTRPFMGKLDELRIWGVYKDFREMYKDITRYVDPKTEQLIAYWDFNEAWGDTLRDLTVNEINGRIINPKWVQSENLGDLPLEIGRRDEVINTFRLYHNYPNPFNPVTQIKFQIPESATVDLVVYDIMGREVKKVLHSKLNSGVHTYAWDGQNNQGQSVASGIYFYRLKVRSNKSLLFSDQKKMILIH